MLSESKQPLNDTVHKCSCLKRYIHQIPSPFIVFLFFWITLQVYKNTNNCSILFSVNFVDHFEFFYYVQRKITINIFETVL